MGTSGGIVAEGGGTEVKGNYGAEERLRDNQGTAVRLLNLTTGTQRGDIKQL